MLVEPIHDLLGSIEPAEGDQRLREIGDEGERARLDDPVRDQQSIGRVESTDDAFEVADRLPKHNWVLILGGSALVLLILQIIPILPWVALVATGVFWWDVRPQLKEIVSGASGW